MRSLFLVTALALPGPALAVDVQAWMAAYDKALRHADPAYAGVDLARFEGEPAGRLAGPPRYVVRIGGAGLAERVGEGWAELPPAQLDSRLEGRAEVALAVESMVTAGEVKAVVVRLRGAGVQRVAWMGRPWDAGQLPAAPSPAYAAGLGSATNAMHVWHVCEVARKFEDGLRALSPARRHEVLVEGTPHILASCAGILDPVKALSALHVRAEGGTPVVARVAPLGDGVKLPDSMPWSRAAPRVVRAGGLR